MDGIVQALLGVDLLRYPEGIRMCLELTEREVGEEIAFPRGAWSHGASDEGVLRDVIDRLAWRDAAMWVFVETIQDLYESPAVVGPVRAAVRRLLAEPVLTRDQRRMAHQLCDSLVCSDVNALVRRTIGDPGYALQADPANLCAVLNELENLPARAHDHLHPAVVFMELLAGEQTPEARERLQQWTDSCVHGRGRLAQALKAVRRTAGTKGGQGPGYCIVELNVDNLDSDRFFVSVMFQDGTAELEPIRPPEDRSYTEDEIRGIIGRVLNESRPSDAADLTVEFLLPGPLINKPVDKWKVGYGGFSLGVQYPIVIRSLDRLRHLRMSHHKWRKNWGRIHEARFHNSDTAIRWVSGSVQENGEQLFAEFNSEMAPVCVLLSKPPVPDQCDALVAALRAGVPILLWCRHSKVDIRSGLNELMTQTTPVSLADLPWRIFHFRRGAIALGADQQHLAHHLTLLWDDADRIPDLIGPLHMPT